MAEAFHFVDGWVLLQHKPFIIPESYRPLLVAQPFTDTKIKGVIIFCCNTTKGCEWLADSFDKRWLVDDLDNGTGGQR